MPHSTKSTRSKCSTGSVLVLLALAAHASRLGAQVPAGQYVLDTGLSDEINRAINDATSDLNFIKKPIARKRLRAANPVPRMLSIKTIGDSVEVIINGDLGLRVKPGTTRDWTGFNGGEKLRVTSSLEGSTLTNTFIAGDGEKRNSYRPRPDGTLELRVHLSSPRLKRPVEYTQIFRKAGG